MYILNQKTVGALVISTSLFSSIAFANDVNLAAYTIPANACLPANSETLDKVTIKNGAYVFKNNKIGTASLLCALPLNGWKSGVSLNTQKWNNPTMRMTSYRVYYKDPNNCSSLMGVQVQLRYRNTGGMQSVGNKWTSWTAGDIGSLCLPGILTNTTKTIPLNHSLRKDRLYHFLVKIKRSNAAQKVTFSGIDFPLNIDATP
ncbi:MAG: hypothetical protein L3J98_16770 [Gammaproteobacteria bacterium]|nr:hypothetical protein [Gammaproteobacteria bacterium]MCF6261782.1 hypothetical protein [Gammaproteobacteria bacterium]